MHALSYTGDAVNTIIKGDNDQLVHSISHLSTRTCPHNAEIGGIFYPLQASSSYLKRNNGLRGYKINADWLPVETGFVGLNPAALVKLEKKKMAY